MSHRTDCTAYSTKGRELADRPCSCGARDQQVKDMTTEELLACFGELGRPK